MPHGHILSSRASCTQVVSYSAFARDIITAPRTETSHSEAFCRLSRVNLGFHHLSENENVSSKSQNVWNGLNISLSFTRLIKVMVVNVRHILLSQRHSFFVPRTLPRGPAHPHKHWASQAIKRRAESVAELNSQLLLTSFCAPALFRLWSQLLWSQSEWSFFPLAAYYESSALCSPPLSLWPLWGWGMGERKWEKYSRCRKKKKPLQRQSSFACGFCSEQCLLGVGVLPG